jgi:hypothetical protein
MDKNHRYKHIYIDGVPKKTTNVNPRFFRTEYRTEFIENRTEFTETEKFGSLFGSEFLGTEFTEVNTETEPNLLNLPNLPEM